MNLQRKMETLDLCILIKYKLSTNPIYNIFETIEPPHLYISKCSDLLTKNKIYWKDPSLCWFRLSDVNRSCQSYQSFKDPKLAMHCWTQGGEVDMHMQDNVIV